MRNGLRITLMAIMMAVFSTTVTAQSDQAQDKKKCRLQMAEAQAKQIAHELALDDATKQKFIETFCAYQKEVWALCPKGNKQKKVDMTDAEVEKAIKDRFEHRQKILDLRQDYYKKFSKFLTPKQIQRVYDLERNSMNRLAKHDKPKPDGKGQFKRPNTKGKGKPGKRIPRQPNAQNNK